MTIVVLLRDSVASAVPGLYAFFRPKAPNAGTAQHRVDGRVRPIEVGNRNAPGIPGRRRSVTECGLSPWRGLLRLGGGLGRGLGRRLGGRRRLPCAAWPAPACARRPSRLGGRPVRPWWSAASRSLTDAGSGLGGRGFGSGRLAQGGAGLAGGGLGALGLAGLAGGDPRLGGLGGRGLAGRLDDATAGLEGAPGDARR